MKRNKIVVISVFVMIALFVVANTVAAQGINGSGWWSAVQVQRVASTTAGSIDVSMVAYAPSGSATGPWTCGTRALAAFGSGATFIPHWTSDPSGQNCSNQAGFPANFQGSSVLSAGDQIVAIAQTQNISFGGFAPGDTPFGRAVAAYAGVGAPSNELKFPVYKNNHSGEMTTFFIQNADSSTTANITATFKPCADQGNGTACLGFGNTYTYATTIEPNKMVVVDATLAKAGSASMPTGDGSFGGMTITSNVPLAGVVIEHSKTAAPATYLKATRGFGTTDYDTVVYAPAVKYQYPGGSTANASKWSGVIIHNADTTATTVDLTYTLASRNNDPNHPAVGTQYTDSASVNPGESAFFLLYNASWANPPTGAQPGDLFSLKVDGNGKNIVAIVNEEGNFALPGDRDLATYSAMPANAAGIEVSVPAYKEQYNGKFHGVVAQNVGSADATIEATITVVDTKTQTNVNNGDVVKIKTTVAVKMGQAVTFFMVCKDFFNQFDDLAGDDAQAVDICSSGGSPAYGSNTSMILTSAQPMVVLANEELLWYVNPSSAGDGRGEDASNYEGFKLK